MATGQAIIIESSDEDASVHDDLEEQHYPSDIEDRPISSPEPEEEENPNTVRITDPFESLSQETRAKIEEMRDRNETINILVIGPTGSGKSTIVNSLMGEYVTQVEHGAESVQSETIEYEGEVKGIQIKVYDTIGFGDTRGKSGKHIVREIAKKNKFDLILICLKFDSRASSDVKDMFKTLKKEISKEMWERSVIILTFTNIFLQLESVKKLTDEEKEANILGKIDTFQGKISDFLSGKVTESTLRNIPFRIAGNFGETNLPTTENWLKALWESCISRCSERSRPLLKFYSTQRLLGITGNISLPTVTGAVAGGIIGAGVGVVGHVPGMVGGAALGAVAGAAVMGAVSGGIVGKDTQKKKNK
uniref:AIG1-type G domain-containing protein n=1 Tax=Amphimedon queenslandica TaxID=400682 RepID=A0A1X7VQH9_AMPQE